MIKDCQMIAIGSSCSQRPVCLGVQTVVFGILLNVNLQAAAWKKHCQFIMAACDATTAGLQTLTIPSLSRRGGVAV